MKKSFILSILSITSNISVESGKWKSNSLYRVCWRNKIKVFDIFRFIAQKYRSLHHFSVNLNGTCQDDQGCSEITFNSEICAIADVNEKCCSSCYHHCRDGPTCKKYPSISNLCEVSDEVRQMCPQSCGICGK